MLIQFHGQVEGCLPAEGRQHGVRLLGGDHLFEHLPGEGLDVGPISRPRVGHDRGGVGVHQHHPVTVIPQGLAGLGAGVVELTGLTNDDRPGADQKNGLEVVAAGHQGGL